MSVIEPSYAVIGRNGQQTGGRRLVRSASLLPQLELRLGLAWLGLEFCMRYVSNRQIYEDLCVPLFADHIRTLTASFDSKLADVGNPLLRKLG